MTCILTSMPDQGQSFSGRTQVGDTNATRKIEQFPPAMHRDPRTLAFLNHVLGETV